MITEHDHELRTIVRRALLEMLQNGEKATVAQPHRRDEELPTILRTAPEPQECQLVLTGSKRSIGLLQEALSDGDQDLEIAIGSQWGPKVRVQAKGGPSCKPVGSLLSDGASMPSHYQSRRNHG